MNLNDGARGAGHIRALAGDFARDTGSMESWPNVQERLFKHGNQVGCFLASGGFLLLHSQVDLFHVRVGSRLSGSFPGSCP